MNASSDSVAALDGDLRLLFLNREAERTLGQSLGGLAGKPVSQVVRTPAGRMLQEHCRECIASARPVRFEHASGERVYEFDIRPTAGGGAAIWFREVTDRKRMQDNLRSSEQRLRLLIDNVKDYAMFALDSHGRAISWNPGAERILGYRASSRPKTARTAYRKAR